MGSPLLSRLLFRLPPETAHHAALRALRLGLAAPVVRSTLRDRLGVDHPALATHAMGLTFANPVGLAAGYDKNAEAFAELAALGFGFVEVGTLTVLPQSGNPRPRLFRLPADSALVNRLGFNNAGARAARARLAARSPADGVVGVNVGRNRLVPEPDAAADYERAVATLAPVADYLVVNVSSPNTPGLRGLQEIDRLEPLLRGVLVAAGIGSEAPPVLVKVSPDAGDEHLDAIADLCVSVGVAGIVATNTTTSRAGLRTAPAQVRAAGDGGLSGPPLAGRSLAVLRRLHARAGGSLVLVSAGGIADAGEAWRRIRAGATLVQIYTGLVYGGPAAPARIARGLLARARAEGFERVQDAVGAELRAQGAG